MKIVQMFPIILVVIMLSGCTQMQPSAPDPFTDSIYWKGM